MIRSLLHRKESSGCATSAHIQTNCKPNTVLFAAELLGHQINDRLYPSMCRRLSTRDISIHSIAALENRCANGSAWLPRNKLCLGDCDSSTVMTKVCSEMLAAALSTSRKPSAYSRIVRCNNELDATLSYLRLHKEAIASSTCYSYLLQYLCTYASPTYLCTLYHVYVNSVGDGAEMS